ncbi:MAG: hypothetical protein JJE52_16020, partial [Acidimicrobiia bacterium]|nr:hypothetical protein [Acidimicrobiia bacterium]
RGTARSALELDEATDLARWVAEATPSERAVLSGRGHLSEAHLDAQAMAWRAAGAAGVRALDEPSWIPPVSEMAAARDALIAAGVGGSTVQVRSNRITVGGVEQYRRSRDGCWYRFVKQSGRWVMTSAPAADLDELLDPDVGGG